MENEDKIMTDEIAAKSKINKILFIAGIIGFLLLFTTMTVIFLKSQKSASLPQTIPTPTSSSKARVTQAIIASLEYTPVPSITATDTLIPTVEQKITCSLDAIYENLCTQKGENGFIAACDLDNDDKLSFIDYSMFANKDGKTNSRARIWQQITTPSKYNAHIIRGVDGQPDMSLEKIRLVGVVFFPKFQPGEEYKLDDVKKPIEELLASSASFWERTLDYKTKIRSELLPIEVRGQKYGDEYTFDQIINELEDAFKNQAIDQEIKIQGLDIISQNKKGLGSCPSSKEYVNFVVVIIKGLTRAYPYLGSSNLQITNVPVTFADLEDWEKRRIDNLFAHEIGHGFNFPDQYKTNTENDEWYDSDPNNIMGQNMWGASLSQLHLADSIKKWVLNKIQ